MAIDDVSLTPYDVKGSIQAHHDRLAKLLAVAAQQMPVPDTKRFSDERDKRLVLSLYGARVNQLVIDLASLTRFSANPSHAVRARRALEPRR